jgi:hypothetical protein
MCVCEKYRGSNKLTKKKSAAQADKITEKDVAVTAMHRELLIRM